MPQEFENQPGTVDDRTQDKINEANDNEFVQVQTEVPAHDAPKQHADYPEKPPVQELHEQLTNETPTGYKAYTEPVETASPEVVQESQSDEQTESYPEAFGKGTGTLEDEPTEENTRPTESVSQ